MKYIKILALSFVALIVISSFSCMWDGWKALKAGEELPTLEAALYSSYYSANREEDYFVMLNEYGNAAILWVNHWLDLSATTNWILYFATIIIDLPGILAILIFLALMYQFIDDTARGGKYLQLLSRMGKRIPIPGLDSVASGMVVLGFSFSVLISLSTFCVECLALNLLRLA